MENKLLQCFSKWSTVCSRMKTFRLRNWRMSSLMNICRRTLYVSFRLVAWVPVVFILLVQIWGYYVYVYIIHLSGSFTDISFSLALAMFLKVSFLASAHVILFLQLASFVCTIFARHKAVPKHFHLSNDQLDELDQASDERALLQQIASHLPVQQLSRGGGVRYCAICELIKPDRCHHCSVCNRCVLKMDHHCPWVNNCVGFSNYKFFVLFLMYTVALCFWLCITGLNAFVAAWATDSDLKQADKFQVIFWYFVCAMFGLSTSILLFFHVYLMLYNKTTLENIQPPHIEGTTSHSRLYFVSYKSNFKQVLGKHKLFALLPIFTSEGNGVEYPVAGVLGSARRSRTTSLHNNDGSDIEFSSERQPLTKSQP